MPCQRDEHEKTVISFLNSPTLVAGFKFANGAPSEPPAKIDHLYPLEGGLQAWTTVLGSFLVQMCTFGSTASFGVYQDFYVREYIINSSPSEISLVGGVNSFLVVAGGVVSGGLYDRGYFYLLLWGGSLLTVASTFLLSFAQPNKYHHVLLAQGVGVGLGGALIYAPSIAIIAQYFDQRRTLAMSLSSIGALVGSVIQPLLLNNLLSNPSIGFANTVRINAALTAVLLLSACLLMRYKESKGTGCDNTRTAGISKRMKKIWTDRPLVATLLACALSNVAGYFPLFYIQLDAAMHHVSEPITRYSLVIMNLSAIPGCVIPGLATNALDIGKLMTAASVARAALIFGMIGLNNTVSVVLISILYGFFSAIVSALVAPFVSVLSSDNSELGMRIGVAFFFAGAGGLIGPPVEGALLTSSLIWWRPILFSGLTMLLGGFLFGAALWFCGQKDTVAEHPISGLANASEDI